MIRQNCRAQSILEYILVLTAVVTLIIWAVGTKIKPAAETTLKNAETAIDKAAEKF